MWPLYAAGFTTAFGAHGVAANLGARSDDAVASLLTLGVLLALYDGAEVILKPVFGSLADRIGARPVVIAGLIGFAAACCAYVVGHNVVWLWVARLGQGAGAAAFSPAASALVARLNPTAAHGRAFGSYGLYKSIGYTLGPLLGGLLVWLEGMRLLFAVMAVLAVAVAVWVALAVPRVPPLPRRRQTVVDLLARLTDGAFVRPTMALAAATAALAVGVGFLPVSGAAAGYGTLATGAAVSVLALTAAVVQPYAGRALDARRITTTGGIAVGMLVTVAGLACAVLPGIAGILLAALLIGAGTGLITPVGFAALASSTPVERLGQTMGSAEVGRELGDAGGPLLVGAIAATLSLGYGYAALAAVLAIVAGALLLGHRREIAPRDP